MLVSVYIHMCNYEHVLFDGVGSALCERSSEWAQWQVPNSATLVSY